MNTYSSDAFTTDKKLHYFDDEDILHDRMIFGYTMNIKTKTYRKILWQTAFFLFGSFCLNRIKRKLIYDIRV